MVVEEKTSQFAVKVKVFGLFREIVGKKEVDISLDGRYTTVDDLKRRLSDSYPQLASSSAHFIVSVNRRIAHDSTKVTSSDEIAIMPMVSGG